ncbi:MAG: hypothetical protein ACRDRS_01710 [Pseudonocardiaceae bacterium]
MRLHLVNDLPLFGIIDDRPSGERLVHEEVRRLCSLIPASVTYLSFDDVERLWANSVPAACDVLVLVGTRPPRLCARRSSIRNRFSLVVAATLRTLNSQGHTESVLVTFDTPLDQLGEAEELYVIDDVAMSGITLQAVLTALSQHRSWGSMSVRVLVATVRSLEQVRASFPTVNTRAEMVLDFEPIDHGTVIFLWDLLYGTLRGQPFLTQTELLLPFFGRDLSVLYRLRHAIADGGTK